MNLIIKFSLTDSMEELGSRRSVLFARGVDVGKTMGWANNALLLKAADRWLLLFQDSHVSRGVNRSHSCSS